MDELGATPENIETGTGNQAGTETGTETTEKTVQTSTPTVTQAMIDDWTKDQRYEKSWTKDPNRLYKSYRDMEKTYNPLKQRAELYDNKFKTYGLELEKFDDIAKEYQSLKDPNRRENQVVSYFDKWLGNPLYKQQVEEFFSALEKKELQAKWGDNIPPEVLTKLEKFEQFQTKSEKEKQDREFQEKLGKTTELINEQVGKIEAYAKKYGLLYDDATHKDLIDYCRKNEIDPKYLFREFKEWAEPEVEKFIRNETEAQTAKRLQEKRKEGITPVSTKVTALAKPIAGSREAMRNDPIFKRMFHK